MKRREVLYDHFSFDEEIDVIEFEWNRVRLKPMIMHVSNEKQLWFVSEYMKTKAKVLGGYSVKGDLVIFEYNTLEKLNSRIFPFSDETLYSSFLT